MLTVATGKFHYKNVLLTLAWLHATGWKEKILQEGFYKMKLWGSGLLKFKNKEDLQRNVIHAGQVPHGTEEVSQIHSFANRIQQGLCAGDMGKQCRMLLTKGVKMVASRMAVREWKGSVWICVCVCKWGAVKSSRSLWSQKSWLP